MHEADEGENDSLTIGSSVNVPASSVKEHVVLT